MKKLLLFFLLVLIFTGCWERKVLVFGPRGRVISEQKSFGEISIVHIRKDGTMETYSTDQGSYTFSDSKEGIYEHQVIPGGYYYYRQGRYYPVRVYPARTESWRIQHFRLRSALMW